LFSGAAAWSLPARAQRMPKLPSSGYLGHATCALDGRRLAAFVKHLRDLGWIEGRAIAIEYRWAEGRNERLAETMAEFVRLKMDVILTSATALTLAVKQATTGIPSVSAAHGDPVGTGVVGSLARPGGDATALSLQQTDAAGRRIDLLRQVLPGRGRFARPTAAGVQSHWLCAKRRERRASSALRRLPRISALPRTSYLRLTRSTAASKQFTSVATRSRSSTGFTPIPWQRRCARGFVEAGGLTSYGGTFAELGRAAELVDKIQRGAKPAGLPVEQPTKFELLINLKVAKALGITVPQTLLVRADGVIE
jgi:putative tryptophan/tyrosine transport system substrate-binding protein